MESDLGAIKAALATISEPDLHALIDATKTVPQIAPGFLAWLEAACDWELNDRLGLSYPLLSPEASIPAEENAASIDAAFAIRMMFRSEAVRALFMALAQRLTGGERKH